MEVFVCIHRKFSPESVGERMLKIGPHLPKLSNIKGYTFWGHSIVTVAVWPYHVSFSRYSKILVEKSRFFILLISYATIRGPHWNIAIMFGAEILEWSANKV